MEQKIALVTGGSKGIGLATVLRFVDQDHRVITCGRDPANWQSAVSSHPQLEDVDFRVVDLSEQHQVESLFSYIKTDYGKLDIAVNNASPKLTSGGTFSHVDIHDLFSTLIDDLWVHALCLKLELLLMQAGAAVVNVSSVNGIRPAVNASMYCAAKHGLEGLTRSVALEAIQQGIRVNAVAPGVTWTPRWEQKQAEVPTVRQDVENAVPIHRFAEPDEIAGAISWLCDKESRYVVGHTLIVDGGLSLT